MSFLKQLLGGSKKDPVISPTSTESTITDIVKHIRDWRNYDSTQLNCSYTVEKFISNGGDARLIVREIVPLLKDSDSCVRHRTAIALGQLSYDGAPDSLNQALSRVVKPLIDALADDDHEVVECAIGALVKLDRYRAVKPLSDLINRTLASTRPDFLKQAILSRALEGLGSVQDPRAVAALIAALQSDTLKWHRGEVARALGKMGAISAIPALTEALKRSDLGAWDRGLVAKALSLLNTPPTRPSPPAVASVPPFEGSTPTIEPAAPQAVGAKAESSVLHETQQVPPGSKAELISMIEAEIDRGSSTETAAKVIAASKRFAIDVVKELVIESFFDKMPENVRNRNDVRFVSMQVGAAMGEPSFAKWLAENIVSGRSPAQMIEARYVNGQLEHGSYGMWSDAKALCEKLGIRFG